MWACLHEDVLYSYGLHMLVSVGGGHVPACSLLWKEGAPQTSYRLYHLTRTAANNSNPTQMKLVGQTSHASLTGWRKQLLLTIMLKRFKSADLGALTQHRMAADIWAKPHSVIWREKIQWISKTVRHLLQSVRAHSCLVPLETRQMELQAGTRLVAMNWN